MGEKGREAVVFVSHVFSGSVLSRFRKMKNEVPRQHDVFFLYDASDATAADIRFAQRIIGDPLRTFEVSQLFDVEYPNPWADSEQQTVKGNLDLLFVHFSQIEPSYSRYWFVEYDVAYTGHWSEVFEAFKESNADLLGTTLTPYEHRPDWYWWPSVDPASDINQSEWIRGFFPIIRLSTSGLEILNEAYQAGWSGHFEAVIPTLLQSQGLKIEDIGGNGPFVKSENCNRFYTNSPERQTLSPGSFVYRPTRPRPGMRAGTLWHPIKPDVGYLRPYMQLLRHQILSLLE